MVPPSLGIDLRCSTKLTPDHHRHIVKHAPLSEIIDQCRKTLVKFTAVIPHQIEVRRVAVPTTKAEADHPHASLHQPPSHEQMVVAGRWSIVLILVGLAVTVGLTDTGVFPFEVERLEQSTAGQHVKSSLRKGIHPCHYATGIDITTQRVDRCKQFSAIR